MRILFIRHAVTDWNQQAKIQGRADIPLNDAGRSQLAARVLRPPWLDARCYTSTLARTIETARLLGARQCCPVPALREMHWGDWEGQTLADLRQRDPAGFAENESKGLDFRPVGGESPREVRDRLAAWLASLSQDLQRVVIITHKGVIRAALSLASGWDMKVDFSRKINWHYGHEFIYSRCRGLAINNLNRSLEKPTAGSE